ncbi:hypothetical protein GIB67_040204 [Kingdonia uniflora]|uniref:Transposase MuDR plant domain-containing protein n=1 Tax=Kingdonia uniflora TaxID=39325 RepID=A0A7J7MV79_9MAGN|nr:hypothetical protein GIB67_040204 [Kingdonia uniflora]
MQWPIVFDARKYYRNFAIIWKFHYMHIKNESIKLRMKCFDPKCKWLAFVSRLNDEHTMELKGYHFEHDCKGKLGSGNKLANAQWVPNEVEDVTICIERIVGSYDMGYNVLPELNVQILLSNHNSISSTSTDGVTK